MSIFRNAKKIIGFKFQQLKQFALVLKNSLSDYFRFLHDHRYVKKYFWISLVIPVILVLTFVVLLPLRINLPVADGQDSDTDNFIPNAEEFDNIDELKKYSRKMVDLKYEELFLNSQLTMAKRDSINLIVNLADSVISLNIKGVTIRECKIHRYQLSHAFKHIKTNPLFFHWLAEPFALEQEWATTPKVPIKIRKAPKDTNEAKKYKTEPAALDKPDVYCTMQFDRNLFLRMHQIEASSFWGGVRKWFYNKRLFLETIKDAFVAFFHLTSPEIPFWIELKISKNDALAIYRALPDNAALALKLPSRIR